MLLPISDPFVFPCRFRVSLKDSKKIVSQIKSRAKVGLI